MGNKTLSEIKAELRAARRGSAVIKPDPELVKALKKALTELEKELGTHSKPKPRPRAKKR